LSRVLEEIKERVLGPGEGREDGMSEPREGDRAPHLIQLSTVAAEDVDHLDDGRLIRGKVTLFSGDAGSGKSQISLGIAANITRGRPIFPPQLSPGAKERPPGNVLLLVGEDGLGDTIRPRIDALDGDPDRVFAMRSFFQVGKNGDAKEFDVDLKQVDVLEAAMREVKPDLVIVDPVQSFLPTGVDINSAADVRSAIKSTIQLAEQHKAALVLIAHLNKGNGRALYRSLGSIDFVALARSVLITGEHEGRAALAHAKASLTRRAPTLLYSLDAGVLSWTGTADVSADDITSAQVAPGGNHARQEAAEFLEELLTGGPLAADEVEQRAQRAGIAPRTLRRAKKQLGIQSSRVGAAGGGGYFTWALPSNS
jgi:hypothetical protein